MDLEGTPAGGNITAPKVGDDMCLLQHLPGPGGQGPKHPGTGTKLSQDTTWGQQTLRAGSH